MHIYYKTHVEHIKYTDLPLGLVVFGGGATQQHKTVLKYTSYFLLISYSNYVEPDRIGKF